jgi:hypothetical protein
MRRVAHSTGLNHDSNSGGDVDLTNYVTNSRITQTIDPANTTSTQLVTHGGLTAFIGSNTFTNGVASLDTNHVHTGTFGAGNNTASVGYMKMGTIDATLNHQGIAHSDRFDSTNYALKQRPDGLTEINCASSSYIFFKVGHQHPPELSIASNYNQFNGYVLISGSRTVGLTRIKYTLVNLSGYWVAPENNQGSATTTSTNLSLQLQSGCYASTYYQSSDDRRKHNELKFKDGDGLRIVKKLQPLIYEKTDRLYNYGETRDPDDDFTIEAGFIAQEVKKIPELEFVVRGGDYVDEAGQNVTQEYSLDYQSIWTVAVKAIQELSAEVAQLKVKLAQLEGN